MTRHNATPIVPPISPDAAPEPDRETAKLQQRMDALEKEKLQLQIDRAAKEQVIGHMVDERRGFIEQLTSQGREIGRLEMQVRQLEAPKPDITRHDVRDDADVRAENPDLPEGKGRGVIEAEPVPVVVPPESVLAPQRSFFQKLFGGVAHIPTTHLCLQRSVL